MGRKRIHTAFILYKTLGYPELGYIIRAKPYLAMAKKWWEKALKNGNKDAKERLEQVYE